MSGIDWETEILLDADGDADHEWTAHAAGYIDPEIDDIEAELLADEGEPDDASGGES